MDDSVQNLKPVLSEVEGSNIQNVLVVGGSGYVASLTLPLLPRRLHLRIFDLKPPAESVLNRQSPPGLPDTKFVQGDVTNSEALIEAARGMDLLLYMAMGQAAPGYVDTGSSFDVNVKGLHFALDAAVKAGIKRAVYTSSLSVYDGQYDLRSGATDSEKTPPAPRRVYGFTKLLGEEVCRYFHRAHHLPVVILRLFLPVSDEARRNPPDSARALAAGEPDCRTAASDLARALTAALEYEHTGLEIIHLTGDTTGQAYHHQKAKQLLSWEPSF